MAAVNKLSLTSSPDLLGEPGSNLATSPAKSAQRGRSTTPKKQVIQTPGTYQLQDFYINTPTGGVSRRSSPSKSVAQSENLISPWRIRVRVEAEREDEGTGPGRKRGKRMSTSPSKQVARTITTTVPLKGSDDTPAPQKRGRGRPRKSDGPAKTPAKRPGTPKPGRGKKRAAEDTDGNESDASQHDTVPKSKGSRRKATPKPAKERTNNGETETPSQTQQKAFAAEHQEATQPFDFADDDNAGLNGMTQTQQNHMKRPSSESPKKIPVASSQRKRQPLVPTSPQKGKPNEHIKAKLDLAPSDTLEEHSDYDSIAEGEDFSVVSLSTLPSAQQHLSSRGLLASSRSNLQGYLNMTSTHSHSHLEHIAQSSENLTQNARPSALTKQTGRNNSTQEPNLGNTQPRADQSSLLNIIKRATPSQLFSSPALPPMKPLQDRNALKASGELKDRSEGLKRAVEAGMVRQDIAEPAETLQSNEGSTSDGTNHPHSGTVRNRFDGLFSGFGVQTRRELKAGLRLGEELAKRQQQAEEHAENVQKSEDDVFQAIARSSQQKSQAQDVYPSAKQRNPDAVQYPQLSGRHQLPSPDTSVDGNNGHADKKSKTPTDKADSDTSSVRERKAVSRRIAKANSSQVMVINSDEQSIRSPDEYHSEDEVVSDNESPRKDETDIWQTEAKSGSNSQNNSQISTSSSYEQPKRTHLPPFWRSNMEEKRENAQLEPFLNKTPQNAIDNHRQPKETLRYSTPSPQKQTQKQNATFTGFTNFTNDMLDAKDSSPPKEAPVVKLTTSKRASTVDIATESNVAKKQRRTSRTRASVPPSTAKLVQPNSRPSISNKFSQKPTASSASTLPKPQQQTHNRDSLLTTTNSASWLTSLTFHPLLQSATEALTLLSYPEHPQAYNRTPFSAPPTPANQPLPPFSVYLPFNTTHYTRLQTIYLRAQHHPSLHRLSPSHPSAGFQGMEVESLGWRHELKEWELAAAEDFMGVLRREGVRDDESVAEDGVREEIAIEEVVKRVFSLWVGQVQRGEVELREGTAGRWDRKFVGRRKGVVEGQRRWRELNRT